MSKSGKSAYFRHIFADYFFRNIFLKLFLKYWAYAETISSHTEHTRKRFHRLLSIRRNFSVKRGVNCMIVDPSPLQRVRLVYGRRGWFVYGRRGRFVYGWRGRFVYRRRGWVIYGGGDSSTEGEIRIRRGDSSTDDRGKTWFNTNKNEFLRMLSQRVTIFRGCSANE
jgi:hypothetical protein